MPADKPKVRDVRRTSCGSPTPPRCELATTISPSPCGLLSTHQVFVYGIDRVIGRRNALNLDAGKSNLIHQPEETVCIARSDQQTLSIGMNACFHHRILREHARDRKSV